MKPLTKEKEGVLIKKNDTETLSEHVDWNFHFICYINWVLVQSGMRELKNASLQFLFLVLISESPLGVFRSIGLRQDNPLWSFLFTVVVEGFGG